MALLSTQAGSRVNFKVGLFFTHVSNMYSLEDLMNFENGIF